jgi:hypothetical protein
MKTPSETAQTAQQLLAEWGSSPKSSPAEWLETEIENCAHRLLQLVSVRDAMQARQPMRYATRPDDKGASAVAVGGQSVAITPPTAFSGIARAAADVVMTAAVWSNPNGRHARRAAARTAAADQPLAQPSPAEDPERAAYLRRWEGAPAQATHLSEDSDGLADWWTGDPKMDEDDAGIVTWVGDEWLCQAPTGILGSVRCEPRPDVQP